MAIIGHPNKSSIKVEAYTIRKEGGFVDFVKGEEIYPLIKPLYILKEDLYQRQINDFIIRFWVNIKTLVSQANSKYVALT